jgi:hypothetical protein
MFELVREIGMAMPGVESATKYDGSPVLKVEGLFLAGVAMHPSAEAGTLVVRCKVEDRDLLIAEAPETYYVTDYYSKYDVALVRLSQVSVDALRDLLLGSWKMTKTRRKAL